MVPAGPLVKFAVSKLVSSSRLDNGGRRGRRFVIGAVVDGRGRKRFRARPDPGVVRRTLHVAGDVGQHLLVVVQLFPGGAGAQALDQFFQEEVQMAAARHVVLAQVANGRRDLDQSQGSGVFSAEGEDENATPDVAAEEGWRHGAHAGGPTAHVVWVEGSLGVESRVLGNGYETVESVTALGAAASRREVVSVKEEAGSLQRASSGE
jgi:hypothetical protein